MISGRRIGRRCSSRSSASVSWSAAGFVMLVLAWFGSYVSHQGRVEQNPVLLWLIVPQLSSAVHRDTDRLVHGRGRAAAVGDLRRAADR